MSKPLESHWQVVKHIPGYLKGTLTWGLSLRPISSFPVALYAYCDVGCGSDHDDRRSTSGACVFIARSSTKAKYRSLALASPEILCSQSLLTELDVPYTTPTIFCV